MTDKDDYKVQRARIEKIVKELAPNAIVKYDPDKPPNYIKFRIEDSVTGTILAVSSGDWHTSEIADKSDDWLRQFIRELAAGKIWN